MTSYRRNRVPGGRYFFTANLADRQARLLVDHVAALRAAFRVTRARHPFTIEAIVVLPDHLHTIWALPLGDADFSVRWRLIKSTFSRAVPRGVGWLARRDIHHPECISASRRSKGERGIWQRRFWEHTLRDDRDVARHIDYIHFNPVRHGLVSRVADWPYSSFHRFVRMGIYPPDWAGDARGDAAGFGERRGPGQP